LFSIIHGAFLLGKKVLLLLLLLLLLPLLLLLLLLLLPLLLQLPPPLLHNAISAQSINLTIMQLFLCIVILR
jgi:hypothetical protein